MIITPNRSPSAISKIRFAVFLLLLACAVNVLVSWVAAAAYFGADPHATSKTGGWEWRTRKTGPFVSVQNFGVTDSPYPDRWAWVLLERSSRALPAVVDECVVAFVPDGYFGNPAETEVSVQSMPRTIRPLLAPDSVDSESEFAEFITMWRNAVTGANVYWESSGQRRSFFETHESRLRHEFEIGRLDRARYKNYWMLQCGYPFPSMASVYSQYAGGTTAPLRPEYGIPLGQPIEMPVGTIFHTNNPSPEPLLVQRSFPTRFIWPGFFANTAINAVVLCGVWFVGKAGLGLVYRWRGVRRLARGVCPDCRYDIGDCGSCPECGWNTRATVCD